MSSSQIRANLFGTLTLWRDDEQLDFSGSTTARSLLAYLLLHHSQTQSRLKLAGSFWPEMDEARARRALTQALWRIRNVIPEILESDSQHIQVSKSTDLWIDIETFEKLSKESIDGKNTNSQTLQQAVKLYRGDLLEGLYDDWVFVARERLRELYLRVLEKLVDIEKSNGKFSQALDFALKLTQADPYREAAHREVMRLYFALDRPEAALAQFETCCKILEEEFGLEVDQQTRALGQEIAIRAPDVQAPYLPKVISPTTPWSLDESRPAQLPLIGRDNDRETIIRFLDEAIRGIGGFVLIEGEAGIGKTRLMNEIVRDADWRGIQSLWGSNREGDIASPYASITDAFTGGLTTLRINQLSQLMDKVWFRVLFPLFPQLQKELPELTAAPALSPNREHERLVQAFAKFLSAWGQITPLLIIIDDLHWSNEDNLDLLIELVPHLHNTRVILMGTYRGEDVKVRDSLWKRLAALSSAGMKKHILLERLSLEATSEMIRRSLGLSDEVPLFEKRLFQETQGNPLFILETLRALSDEGILAQDDAGNWHTPWDETTSDYTELPLPKAVERTIAARLEHLSVEERIVLKAAAVLARDFNFSLLSSTAEIEVHQVLSVANSLVRRRFLEETSDAYQFSHDKIRQVAYEAIPKEERALLHRQAGESVQQVYPDRTDQSELLAHHFFEGEVWDQAAVFNQRAGDRAKSLYANNEAIFYYARALQSLEKIPENADPIIQFEVLLSRETVYGQIGEREAQKTDLEQLDALLNLPALGTPERHMQLALHWTDYWEAISDYPSALEVVGDLAEKAELADDAVTEQMAHLRWGQMLRHLGEYTQAHQHLENAYQQSLKNNDVLAQAITLNSLGVVYFDSGNYDVSLEYSQRALEIAKPTGDQAVLSDIHNNLGGVFHYLVDFPAAIDNHQNALEQRRSMGDRRLEASSLYNLAITLSDSGKPDEAKEHLIQVCEIAQTIGNRRLEGYGWVFLGLVLEELGELGEAREAYLRGLELRKEVGLHAMTNDALAGLARVATAESNHTEAVEYANQVLTWIEEHGHEGIGDPLLAYVGAYKALLEVGETERGKAALEDAYQLLMQFANNISDLERRHAYLHDISPGQPIWDDYHEYILGQTTNKKQVHLPKATAPLGRALVDDDLVEIAWTVKIPKDDEISGKIARRQHRLLRLLDEAESQGAMPSVENLASALEVSDRTIKRDLAALRKAGHNIETRGSA